MKQRYIKVNHELIPVTEEVYQAHTEPRRARGIVPAGTAGAARATTTCVPGIAPAARGNRKGIA